MEDEKTGMGCGKMGMMGMNGMGMGGWGGHMGMGGMDHEEMYKMIMWKWLPKIAKMELLKEKMKKKFEAAEGKKLDEMADLMVNTMMEKSKMKRERMMKKQELMEKMEEIMSEDD